MSGGVLGKMARKSLTEKLSRDIREEWGVVHAFTWGKNSGLRKRLMESYQVAAHLLCSRNSKEASRTEQELDREYTEHEVKEATGGPDDVRYFRSL